LAGRVSNRLNAKSVAATKAAGRYADGAGLYLVVDDKGNRRWSFVFQYGGKRKEMGLGTVEDVDLKEAREARDAARKHLVAGRNPIEVRRLEAAARAEVPEFGAYANKIVDGLTLKSDKHREQWRRTLTDYLPGLQKLPVDAIATHHILDGLKPHWTEIPETAERIRGRVERVLDAARAAGFISGPWENPARCRASFRSSARMTERPANLTSRSSPALTRR